MNAPFSKRIGILGGSFDPPHIGHLFLAQDAAEALALDRVFFFPAAAAPLKAHPPVAPASVRLALTHAAVAGHPEWEVSDWELLRGGASYSFHTAEYVRERFPDAGLYWIIGADQLAQLPAWHRIGELGRLVCFAVARRVGSPPVARPAGLDAAVRVEELPTRRVDVSSTEIRGRLSSGASVDLFVPVPVLEIIRREGLYKGI